MGEQELGDNLGAANKKYTELEIRSMQTASELAQLNSGLAARNEVLERQLVESQAEYRRDLEMLEATYVKQAKDYRADTEAKIKRLEQDVALLHNKV